MGTTTTSPAYDKETVLKILASEKKTNQTTITFWYGGWSLNELRTMCPNYFCDQSWYDKEHFAQETHPEGMYTACPRVPNSNNKMFDEQSALLGKDESVCPVAIAATAALLSFLESSVDPFDDDWTRCREQTDDSHRVGLYFYEGRLDVNRDWDDYRLGILWLSSVRTS